MLGPHKQVVSAALVLIAFSGITFGQAGSAIVRGKVTDPIGLVVVNAHVEATNLGTNVIYPAATNDAGFYSLSRLPPGRYSLTVEKGGLASIVNPNLDLHVADDISLNFRLQIGAIRQTETVVGGGPQVNATSSSLGGLVQADEIANMPLNGRNYINLTLLQPGIAPSPNITQGGTYNGTWYSSNGATIRSNNFMLDGAIMQDNNGGSTANFSGRTLGLDGIQEYRVITSSFSAEYGLLAGSQTVMVSKSGSNQFHGSVFEFLRNSALDAANYFDRPTVANKFRRLPAYKRNNYGGAFGGPIRKNKTFFFTTFEGVEERLGITVNNTVMAPACHGEAGAVITNTACPQLGSTPSVTIAPVVAPLLALYPLPNLPNNGYTTPFTQPDRDVYGQIRVDHVFSDKDSMFGRYTIDDDDQVLGNSYPQYFVVDRNTRHQYATLSETHIFSTSLLNDLRVSFSRTASTRLSPSPFSGPQYSLVAGQALGQIIVGGVTGPFGPAINFTSAQTQNILSFSDDLMYAVGSHSLKFGTLINSYRQFGNQSQRVEGQLQFTSIATFLAGVTSSYAAELPGSLLDRTWQFYTTGFYVQDDWRLRSRFTLNAGLRYEPSPNYYTEVHGKSSALIDPLTDTQATVGPYFRNFTWRNISPRLGFAWDVFGDGRTAIRGGASLAYDIGNLYNGFLNIMPQQQPFSFTNSGSGTFTIPLTFPPNSVSKVQSTQQYDMQQARFYNENLTIEQQLPFSMALAVSYAGSRGIHLPGIGDANPNLPQGMTNGIPFWNPNPAQAVVRTNPSLSAVLFRDSYGDSIYHSLQVQVNKRFTSGLQFHNSFTWGRSIDNCVGLASEATSTILYPSNPYNRRFDRGPSIFNIPRIWVTDFIYNLPSPEVEGRWLSTLINGWGVSGIFTAQDGLPFNPVVNGNRSRSGLTGGLTSGIDRPNFNPAFTGSVITGNPTQWFNPDAFMLQPVGTLGNVGRDSLRGPGFVDFDFGMHKNTKLRFLGEAGNIEFRVEAFNLLNHPNLGMPAIATFAGALTDPVTAAPLSAAGQITSTAGTSRQMQFALRISF
jgi:Carboxypeptidase regulatory-like domain/TonB dependent receptor-like, beta-barrel